MHINTERLILRPFTTEDAADLYEYLHEPTQSCFFCMKIDSMEQALEEARQRAADENYFAIVCKENSKVIGEIFAHPEETSPDSGAADTYSPCWMLNSKYQGKGYGYEASYAFIDYLFTSCDARRVYMFTEDTNLACQALCEKLGARQEGLFMEFVSFVNDGDGNPIYENTYQYAILKKEWERNKDDLFMKKLIEGADNDLYEDHNSHCVVLNIYYDLPEAIWDAIDTVYRSMPYWFEDEKTDDYGWQGPGIDLEVSVEPTGIMLCGVMPEHKWKKWYPELTKKLTAALGYEIGDVSEGYQFKYF